MRSVVGQDSAATLVRPSPAGVAVTAATLKEIPYDYVAVFKLTGVFGNRVPDVINVSIEGAFVAVAVGYSFIPPKGYPPDRGDDIWQILTDQLKLRRIEFKYSIIDSGSGRELQNRPIHNIAGLGEASGLRPFRPLAKPMIFMPRSTIRIEIEELGKGEPYVFPEPKNGVADPTAQNAELQIVLHGYKILGYGATS